jgi:hypothetical protein
MQKLNCTKTTRTKSLVTNEQQHITEQNFGAAS